MSNSTTAPLWPLENASPIIWSAADRSFILSAFFYGYVILQVCSHSIRFVGIHQLSAWNHKKNMGVLILKTKATHWMQVPGGRMAEMYGTKKVLGYRSFLKYSSELRSTNPVLDNTTTNWLLTNMLVTLDHSLQHAGDRHPWTSGTHCCLHKLLLHFCHPCCSGRLSLLSNFLRHLCLFTDGWKIWAIVDVQYVQGLCKGVTYPYLRSHFLQHLWSMVIHRHSRAICL